MSLILCLLQTYIPRVFPHMLPMTWLTAMEYLCHKWPWICPNCRNHFPALSLSMPCHQFVTIAKRQVEQVPLTLPDHPSSPLIFVRVCVVQSPVFHVLFYISLSVILFLLAIVLSVFLQFMASDYHIGIFKLFMPYFPKNCQNYK